LPPSPPSGDLLLGLHQAGKLRFWGEKEGNGY
jgi:hypothetical protein